MISSPQDFSPKKDDKFREERTANGEPEDENPLWLRINLPYEIDKNIERLAKINPDGIYEEDFLRMYEERYGTQFDPIELGFASTFQVLLRCPCVTVERLDKRFIVYPKITRKRALTPPELLPMPPIEELPFLWKDSFQEYECDPVFKFKPPEVPSDWELVEIVDAFSPTDFWIQTKKNKDRVNNLMDRLNEYYTQEGDFHETPDFVCPGLAVAGFFLREWHRAVVKSITGDTINLLFVDYGTKGHNIRRCNVKKLHRMFGEDEMMALKASLWNVQPPKRETEWSMDSFTFVYHEWGYITLRMKIVSVDREVPSVEAIFFSDKSSKYGNYFTKWYPNKVFIINELLVEEKHGDWIVAPDPEKLNCDRERARVLQNAQLAKPNECIKQIDQLGARLANLGTGCFKQATYGTTENSSQLTDQPVFPFTEPSFEDIDRGFRQIIQSKNKRVEASSALPVTVVYEDVPVDLEVPSPSNKTAVTEVSDSPRPSQEHCQPTAEQDETNMTCKIRHTVIAFPTNPSKELLVIEDNGTLLVLKKELFSITATPPDVAEYRYEKYGLKALEVLANPNLLDFLNKFGRKGHPRGDIKNIFVLIPLQHAAQVCCVVDPLDEESFTVGFDMILQYFREK